MPDVIFGFSGMEAYGHWKISTLSQSHKVMEKSGWWWGGSKLVLKTADIIPRSVDVEGSNWPTRSTIQKGIVVESNVICMYDMY